MGRAGWQQIADEVELADQQRLQSEHRRLCRGARSHGVVDFVDTNPNFIARLRVRIIGAFGQGWDDAETRNQAIVSAAQSKTNANRHVIVSNEQDFFQDFETNNGASLPSLSCTFGNEWELAVAALAERGRARETSSRKTARR